MKQYNTFNSILKCFAQNDKIIFKLTDKMHLNTFTDTIRNTLYLQDSLYIHVLRSLSLWQRQNKTVGMGARSLTLDSLKLPSLCTASSVITTSTHTSGPAAPPKSDVITNAKKTVGIQVSIWIFITNNASYYVCICKQNVNWQNGFIKLYTYSLPIPEINIYVY